MKKETANLEFENTTLLKEVVEKYNWIYRNTSRKCELKINQDKSNKISISDDGKLLPYGLFEIGTYIGSRLIYESYKIELVGWTKKIQKTVFEEEFHPKNETINLFLKDEELNFTIKNATGINSAIGTIKPFINESDFLKIAQFSEFDEIKNLKSKNYLTRNQYRINYSIVKNYLLIFGVDLRYGKDYYRIDLESAFEIKRPKNDF